MRQPRVHILMPTTGEVRAETMMWLLSYLSHPMVGGFSCNIGCVGVAVQRNYLVQEFLATDNSHLLFLDDDVVPPNHDVISRLLDHDKDIVSGVYPLYLLGKRTTCIYRLLEGVEYDIEDHHTLNQELVSSVYPPERGLKRCDATGGGFLLVRRSVLENMPFPWFDFPKFNSRDRRVGEDIYFGLKARQYGFQPYVDWEVRITHFKAIPWTVE